MSVCNNETIHAVLKRPVVKTQRKRTFYFFSSEKELQYLNVM